MNSTEYDNHLRKALQSESHEFAEGDWEEMQLLLDKHLPQKKRRRFLLFFLLLPILGAGAFLFIYSNKQQLPTEQVFANNIEKSNEKKIERSIPTNVGNEETPIDSSTSDIARKNDLLQKLSRKKIPDSNIVAAKKFVFIAKTPQSNDEIVYQIKRKSKKVYSTTFLENPVNNLNAGGVKEKSPNTNDQKNESATEIVQEEKLLSIIPFYGSKERLGIKPMAFPLQVNATPVIMNNHDVVKNKISKPKAKNSFAILLNTGIEASGTQFKKVGNATTFAGLGFQYGFGKNFSIRAGIQSARKKYSARDEDYNPPPRNWAANVTLNSIFADCKVYEIPVSLSYKIANLKKTTINLSVGSSSYFMKREEYKFNYKTPSGNDTTRVAVFNNNSEHLASTINFSMFLERKISNRLAFFVEPFIKVPVDGIGFGQTKIYNAGFATALKFTMRK